MRVKAAGAPNKELPLPNSPVKQTSGRDNLFAFLSDRRFSLPARYYHHYMDLLVALSLLSICLESVSSFSDARWQARLWRALESYIAVNFILDALLKLGAARPCTKYLWSWTALADALSVLPWIVESISSTATDGLQGGRLAPLRLLRTLRFARFYLALFAALPDMQLFVRAVEQSSLAIMFLLFVITSASLLFAVLLYHAETSWCTFDRHQLVWRTPNDDLCTFQNVFEAVWFVLVTITTVGYGDIQLRSTVGKVIAALMMLCSLVGLSLPVAIFSANLTELYLSNKVDKNGGSRDAQRVGEREERGVLVEIAKELAYLRAKLDSLEQKY